MSVLYPDIQFDDETTVEAELFGDRADLVIFRESARTKIPDAAWRTADAIVCYHFMDIGADVVAKLDRCRLIVRAGVGFDQIALDTCAERGISVCNTPDYGTMEVADHAIASLLALARGTVTFHNAIANDIAKGWDFLAAPTVRRLSGQICGIVGLGQIGTATALRAKALGMDVVFYDPYLPTGTELALGIRRSHTLQDLLAQADVVSLHTPLTPRLTACSTRPPSAA